MAIVKVPSPIQERAFWRKAGLDLQMGLEKNSTPKVEEEKTAEAV